ncbi:MAG: carbon storage regulator [Planctomycetes bacterium]|nr:carbon storage regulator [Planctomycetota bacterium]
MTQEVDPVLILSRRKGEAVMVPLHGIEVRVLRITGSRVQLGFAGPGGTAFVREELLDGNQGFHAEPPHGRRTAGGEDPRPAPPAARGCGTPDDEHAAD